MHNTTGQCFVKQTPNNSEMLINILSSQISQVHLSVRELVLADISIWAPDSTQAMTKASTKAISKATSTQATGATQLQESHHVDQSDVEHAAVVEQLNISIASQTSSKQSKLSTFSEHKVI